MSRYFLRYVDSKFFYFSVVINISKFCYIDYYINDTHCGISSNWIHIFVCSSFQHNFSELLRQGNVPLFLLTCLLARVVFALGFYFYKVCIPAPSIFAFTGLSTVSKLDCSSSRRVFFNRGCLSGTYIWHWPPSVNSVVLGCWLYQVCFLGASFRVPIPLLLLCEGFNRAYLAACLLGAWIFFLILWVRLFVYCPEHNVWLVPLDTSPFYSMVKDIPLRSVLWPDSCWRHAWKRLVSLMGRGHLNDDSLFLSPSKSARYRSLFL